MQSWPVGAPPMGAVHSTLAALVTAIGRPHFATAALTGLGRVLRVGSWAVYQVWRERPPLMHLSASQGMADTTSPCFAIYRDDGLYRSDSSFDAVHERRRAGHPVMLRMHADEAPSARHRDAIYVRHGMVERLSVAQVEADGSLLAVNLYRHLPQDRFSAAEVEHFAALAPTLLAAVLRHVEWAAAASSALPPRDALRKRCAALTERELDVLERLLRGMTYDGIAADTGLSVATVKTYRMRAFERLDIHSRSELFASFVRDTP
jgi:DNA-binding CsgD family transcriptional regulator